MDGLSKCMLLAFGGALGANARYWLGGLVQSRLGSSFPWETMVVNGAGSLAIGVVMGLALSKSWDPRWQLFLAIGVLGGFTTYSSFAFESVNLLADKSYDWAVLYVLGTPMLCVIAAWLGWVVARALVGG